MGIFNLLNTAADFTSVAVDKIGTSGLNWIGKIVQWLIEGVGIVGLGVIVFTILLKTIVLPLDIYSRVKTKKQSLMMKKMRPQMEKLQKQYANDKQMYSQKVMELQKQHGYSMLGACLPMIISLVIFMVVFSAFSTYSQYANLSTYNDMVDAYNASVQTYVRTDENPDGFLIADTDPTIEGIQYHVNYEAFANYYPDHKAEDAAALPEDFLTRGEDESKGENDPSPRVIVMDFVRLNARSAAAAYYKSHRTTFIWVGNIWYPDSMLNKEVPNFSKFSSAVARAVGSGVDASYETSYNEVTHDLGSQKKTYNGYFVLIVLAIGLMLLQQFIMMRSQKDANELSSVDGSGAKTNKWMMIMMPIIYGIFSFFYSAAFSIYMITNTLYGLITTLIINKVMDVSFAKHADDESYWNKSKRTPKRKRLK
ncbi:MAG: YidC/Oxa1 family membrane protein insertase [Clostridia bacterium]|nr:YidC/Oxa1 family membrane protein insertase [Clostridia bacterium]